MSKTIKKKYALEVVQRLRWRFNACNFELMDEAAELIERLLENCKHTGGEWTYEYTGECIEGTDAPLNFRCSICGELDVLPSKFCPSCGTRMGEED